jgi:hypothetical protein
MGMEANVYGTPQSELIVPSQPLAGLSAKELKKIVNSWHRLLVLCGFWGLSTLALFSMVGIFMVERGEELGPFAILIGLGVVYLVCIYGTLAKKTWGRVLGMIVCSLMLFGFPIGTLLGAMGLFGFVGAKPLFGASGLNYAEVKQQYKLLK